MKRILILLAITAMIYSCKKGQQDKDPNVNPVNPVTVDCFDSVMRFAYANGSLEKYSFDIIYKKDNKIVKISGYDSLVNGKWVAEWYDDYTYPDINVKKISSYYILSYSASTYSFDGETTYKYDGKGRVILETKDGGNQIVYDYDTNDSLIKITMLNSANQINSYTKIRWMDNPNGTVSKLTDSYNAAGTLQVSDCYIYTFNSLHKLITRERNMGVSYINGKTTYEYNTAGLLIKQVDYFNKDNPSTNVVTQLFYYDSKNRVIKCELSNIDNGNTLITRYTYCN